MWINKRNVFAILIGLLVVAAMGFLLNSLNPRQRIFIEERKVVLVSEGEKEIRITVRQGFCLSEITHDLGTSWKKVAEINGIENPNLIHPGQELRVCPFDGTNVVMVSWYGAECQGRNMANGETYNMNDITIVAHKWLPFGTRVRLTRIDNKKHVDVIVKDRGPYIKGRIFDVSKAAAEALGMIDEGLTTCTVKILE